MSHPSLGLPPAQPTPLAATVDRLDRDRRRIAARGLEIAIEIDPTFRERHADQVLRELLADSETHLAKLCESIAVADPSIAAHWADTLVPIYRRRRIAMDDVAVLLEAIRTAALEALGPDAPAVQPLLDASADAAVDVLRNARRIAGDARPRDPLVSFLYKGA